MIAAIGAVASNGMLGLDGWLPWDGNVASVKTSLTIRTTKHEPGVPL